MKYIYLGAQSHVAVSFETPEYTSDINALGTLRILEAIRQLGLSKKCKFYQASSSELYGKVFEKPQSEKTPFYLSQSLCCSKTLCLLDHYKLQRSLLYVCV